MKLMYVVCPVVNLTDELDFHSFFFFQKWVKTSWFAAKKCWTYCVGRTSIPQLYCLLATAQTLTPNDLPRLRWQRLYTKYFGVNKGRKWWHVVLCSRFNLWTFGFTVKQAIHCDLWELYGEASLKLNLKKL